MKDKKDLTRTELRELAQDHLDMIRDTICLYGDILQRAEKSYEAYSDVVDEKEYLDMKNFYTKRLRILTSYLPPEERSVTDSEFEDLLDRARSIPFPEIAGQYIPLVGYEGSQKGLCPFHEETTPSFYAYADHYHCYGCGEHGDVINFKQYMDGLSFVDAVHALNI